jgi:ABC-type Zn2+ transport system substrate-binding protein/surface adhesin
MSTKHKHSSESEHQHDHAHRHGPFWKRLHRDWRLWVAVLLMLSAMAVYVMSDDESLQPGAAQQKSVPAADGI